MKRQELQAEFDRLKGQIDSIKKGTGRDRDELISLSSQQVCVAICGSLEQCLKSIFIEYAKRRSGRQIYRPIERVCESYQNPKTKKILDLIGMFDAEFRDELEILWSNDLEVERQHIDNMVDDRIVIAHRKRVHVNITSSKLEDYYKAYGNLLIRVYQHFLEPQLAQAEH